MIFLALLLSAEVAVLCAAVILREPNLLIPAVVLGLPIEYVGTQALGTLSEGGLSGAVRALLNPGKAAMLASIVVAVFRARHNPSKLFPDSAVIVPIVALLSVVVLGVAWSDSLKPENSILIMPMYVAFVFVAPTLIEDRKDVERIVGAFLLIAAMLALVAISQRLFHVFNWRAILVQSDDYSYRSNATFADPNNLARYFAVSMSLAVGLLLSTGPRRQTVYLAIPALALSAAGIVATASRSGWLMLVFCTFLVVLVSPISRYTKGKLVFGSAGALVAMLVLLLFQGGTDAERVKSLASGVQVIGQREFLIKAGWQMFKDSPFIGVGSGNYQHALVVSDLDLIPSWARTTLSHTSLVSLLAELGIVGMLAFLLVVVRVGISMVRAYFATAVEYNRLIIGWLGASTIGILLVSQSEGRLLDEPYLWLILAMFVALETGAGFSDVSLAGAVRVEERDPVRTVRSPATGNLRAPRQPHEVSSVGAAQTD
ncbi:MAG: O-antigen ligase family protein [Anaerolineaceae bacterium]